MFQHCTATITAAATAAAASLLSSSLAFANDTAFAQSPASKEEEPFAAAGTGQFAVFAGTFWLTDFELGATLPVSDRVSLETSFKASPGATWIGGVSYLWREAQARVDVDLGASFHAFLGIGTRYKSRSFLTTRLTNVVTGDVSTKLSEGGSGTVRREERTLTLGFDGGIATRWEVGERLFLQAEWANLYAPVFLLAARSLGANPAGVTAENRESADASMKTKAKRELDWDLSRVRLGVVFDF